MKILLSVIIIVVLILPSFQVFAQQLSSDQAPKEKIAITIEETGTAHVTHIVNGSSLSPIQVEMIRGNITKFSVTDVNGSLVEYGSIQKSPMTIILNTSQRNMTLIKYDLVNIVSNIDGIWKWNYLEPQDTDFTAFHFPKGVDIVWANGRPVYLGNLGLGQHGNGFILEYIINEPWNIQNVQLKEKNFGVGVRTVSGLGEYVFDPSQKTYAFNVNRANVPITVIMPHDLLGGPYNVKINGNATLHQEFHKNATHSWIGLLPSKSGTVQIIGNTTGQEQQLPIDQGGQQTGNTMTIPTSFTPMIITILIGIIIVAVVIGLIIRRRMSKR